jgi:hypothetical protein
MVCAEPRRLRDDPSTCGRLIRGSTPGRRQGGVGVAPRPSSVPVGRVEQAQRLLGRGHDRVNRCALGLVRRRDVVEGAAHPGHGGVERGRGPTKGAVRGGEVGQNLLQARVRIPHVVDLTVDGDRGWGAVGAGIGAISENTQKRVVDGRRLELLTSALRTRRSPN